MKKILSTTLVLILSLVMAFGCVPAFAADNDAAVKAAAAYSRHSIWLDGVSNARELGGYRTKDGRTVKFGKLLRTGKLANATEKDKRRLEQIYHVSKDIDFRAPIERAKDPDPALKGAKVYHYSVLGPVGLPTIDPTTEKGQESLKAYVNSVASLDKDGTLVDQYYKDMYRSFYATEDGVNAYKNFFQQLLNANGNTVLWHCSAGKDRAGNGAMLLLTVLGVDRETIYQDFLNTNIYVQEDMQKAYDTVYKLTKNEKTAEDIASNYGVKRSWLDVSFATIDELYGSMDNFIHQGLGLSDQDIAKLQAAYLE